MTPIINCLKKKDPFLWTKTTGEAFALIKDKLTNTFILAFPDFEKVFELECDSREVGIGVVLLQETKPIAFLSEKLNEAR